MPKQNSRIDVLPADLVGTVASFLDPVSIGGLAIVAGPRCILIIKKLMKDRAILSKQKLAKMKADEKAQARDHIFRQLPCLGRSYQWIEQNRDRFRCPIWGPVICEITDVGNIDIAAYVEHCVPNSKLKAYVIGCEEDYNLLYQEVHAMRNIPINIVRVETIEPVERVYSDEKMAMLRRDHGIVSYLDEAFLAPAVVMQALRNSSQIDKVLIGGTETRESMDRRGLMNILTERDDGTRGVACVFAFRHKYTSRISRLSREVFIALCHVSAPKLVASKSKAMTLLELDITELHHQIKCLPTT